MVQAFFWICDAAPMLQKFWLVVKIAHFQNN